MFAVFRLCSWSELRNKVTTAWWHDCDVSLHSRPLVREERRRRCIWWTRCSTCCLSWWSSGVSSTLNWTRAWSTRAWKILQSILQSSVRVWELDNSEVKFQIPRAKNTWPLLCYLRSCHYLERLQQCSGNCNVIQQFQKWSTIDGALLHVVPQICPPLLWQSWLSGCPPPDWSCPSPTPFSGIFAAKMHLQSRRNRSHSRKWCVMPCFLFLYTLAD